MSLRVRWRYVPSIGRALPRPAAVLRAGAREIPTQPRGTGRYVLPRLLQVAADYATPALEATEVHASRKHLDFYANFRTAVGNEMTGATIRPSPRGGTVGSMKI